MIKLDEVSKIYTSDSGSAIGIQNISAQFDIGEFVVITGESGSGKSTLLNVVSLLDSYEEGELYINGKSTIEFTKEDFVKYQANYVSFVFQDYNLIDSFSVFNNVMLPLLSRGIDKKEAKKRVKSALEEIGIGHLAHRKCSKLSGGEKQRTVIARALVSDTPVLACDEPTGNLDSKTSEEVIKVIKKIAKNHLILLVTHDYEAVKDAATRHIVMKDGHIVKDEQIVKPALESKVEVPIKKRSKLSSDIEVGCKDVVFTPKRSVLSFMVALVTSLFSIAILFGFGSISDSINVSNSTMTTYTYPNYTHSAKKSIVYSLENTTKTIADVIDDEDSFIDYGSVLDTMMAYTSNLEDGINLYSKQFFVSGEISDSYTLLDGRAPLHNDNGVVECIVVFPKALLGSIYDIQPIVQRLLNSNVYGNVQSSMQTKTDVSASKFGPYRIVGLYSENVLTNPSTQSVPFLCFAHDDLSKVRDDCLFSYANSQSTMLSPITTYYRDIRGYINGDEITLETSTSSEIESISVPKKYQNYPFVLNYRGTKIAVPTSVIEYYESYEGNNSVRINPQTVIDLFAHSTAFASVYARDESVARSNEKLLIDNGFNASNADIALSSMTFYNVLNIVIFIIYSILFSGLAILTCFLGSLIFRSIYNSKKKDYAIYQTLAFTRSDIKTINLVEMLFLFVFSSLATYFSLLIVSSIYRTNAVMATFYSVLVNPIYIAIFFFFNIIFAFLCSYNIIKKMEKKTLVNNIHRGGELL
ncbi:MAG: ABC transporter ATP-binding protein [Bacilli bacterium]|jgi:ABC-type lipoprotein export system ATPase subunit